MTPSLILLGPRGSGKTTVGRLVAERLSVPFADVDDLVQRDAGMTIADIFDREGEPGFRDRETAALRSALNAGVVATGGGVVVRRNNRELLKSLACPRVLLTADAATLHAPHLDGRRVSPNAAGIDGARWRCGGRTPVAGTRTAVPRGGDARCGRDEVDGRRRPTDRSVDGSVAAVLRTAVPGAFAPRELRSAGPQLPLLSRTVQVIRAKASSILSPTPCDFSGWN